MCDLKWDALTDRQTDERTDRQCDYTVIIDLQPRNLVITCWSYHVMHAPRPLFRTVIDWTWIKFTQEADQCDCDLLVVLMS